MFNSCVILRSLYVSGLRNSTLRALLCGDVKEELKRGLGIVKVPVYALGMGCHTTIWAFLTIHITQSEKEWLKKTSAYMNVTSLRGLACWL